MAVPLHAQKIPVCGREDVLELANWNCEWFGKTSPGFGPDNDRRQRQLVSGVIAASAIDVWALCEISDIKAFDTLMSGLPAYGSALATYAPEQKTAVLFRHDMFTFAGARLLGTANKDSFSTRRYPLEVALIPKNIPGIDTLFIVVIHLKANTGNDSQAMQAYNSRKRSSEWLHMYLSTQRSGRYTAVLGDWNDDLDRSIYKNLPTPFTELMKPGASQRFTTLKLTQEGIGTTTGFSNAIDHQLVSGPLAQRFISDSVFAWRLGNFIAGYADSCSDHYPVYSLFRLGQSSIMAEKEAGATSVSPNPATSCLRVSACETGSLITLYDVSGRAVWQRTTDGDEELDVSGLGRGTYYYTVGSGEITKKGILILQ